MKIKLEKSKIFLVILIVFILSICIATVYSASLLRERNIGPVNSQAAIKCKLADAVNADPHQNELAELSSTDHYICGKKDCGDATIKPQMYCDLNNNCTDQKQTKSCFGNICKQDENYCSSLGTKCSKTESFRCGANLCNKGLSLCLVETNTCVSETDIRCSLN